MRDEKIIEIGYDKAYEWLKELAKEYQTHAFRSIAGDSYLAGFYDGYELAMKPFAHWRKTTE